MSAVEDERSGLEIAVIGVSGRFPGAPSVEVFWDNLCQGIESVVDLSPDELRSAGVPEEWIGRADYVPRQAVLEGHDLFDAEFFGFLPSEAALLDPQHRIFLECAWEAFESAGYVPERVRGRVGVYAGSSTNGYAQQVFPRGTSLASAADLSAFLAFDKDFLATRVSYKLNLTGPSLVVQTACSTSLVAVHLATQALLNGECELALAGGVSVAVPHGAGYFYQEGGIASPDGRCRPFDARAQGTVLGSGAGVVLLKRLEDAVEDKDAILAVIKGSALNNDGRGKVGYTAPSVAGQARVIRDAQSVAGVKPASIGYVEAHGTATPLGDPIEVTALREVFGGEARSARCVLGSVKGNVGHLDAAAGVTGLIKAILAVGRGQVPGTLHLEAPHPGVDWVTSPFRVSARTESWPALPGPRRAAVSSFGLGGTNAHVVLEEAPLAPCLELPEREELLLLSARSPASLGELAERLALRLEEEPGMRLADVAYTLRAGRRAFSERRALVARTREEAIAALRSENGSRGATTASPRVVLLFPGQGAQAPNSGRSLYEESASFRADVDACARRLESVLGRDLRELLFPGDEPVEIARAATELDRTSLTQPALFVLEYALARFWMACGVRPNAFLGHSLGEYVAACLAGCLTLDEALVLVAARGRLIETTAVGALLVVAMPEDKARELLSERISLAAVNAERQCVLAGPVEAIEELERALAARGEVTRRLRGERGFHSVCLDGVRAEFEAELRRVDWKKPEIPWISNVTGTWITDEEATDPRYWARHLRETVRFADGVRTLAKESFALWLEVGPGRTLTGLTQRILSGLEGPKDQAVVASLVSGSANTPDDERRAWLEALGRAWTLGAPVKALDPKEDKLRRVPLPTTPFERKRYWATSTAVEEEATAPTQSRRAVRAAEETDVGRAFYAPVWCRSPASVASPRRLGGTGQSWLVYGGDPQTAELWGAALAERGSRVVRVPCGGACPVGQLTHVLYLEALRPCASDDLDTLAQRAEELAFGLCSLARTVGRQGASATLLVLTAGANEVLGGEGSGPERAPLVGIARSLPLEYPDLTVRVVDLEAVPASAEELAKALKIVEVESDGGGGARVVASRAGSRWEPNVVPLELAAGSSVPNLLRQGGVYLITGGLGGIGGELARFLAKRVGARLTLVQRSEPNEEQRALFTELRGSGAEVLFLRADASRHVDIEAAARATVERFGALHGVIHAAGVAIGGLVDGLERSTLTAEFAPKVRGALALQRVVTEHSADFLLLLSSLTALSGGVGQSSYAGANAFLDAVADISSGKGSPRVVSVNLDRWLSRGMAARARERLAALGVPAGEEVGFSSREGEELFCRLFSADVRPRLITSARPLRGLPRDELGELWARRTESAAPTGTSRRAVTGDAQEQMTKIWERAFGVTGLDPNRSFFELGGESLLALQIVNRVREIFGVELSLRDFFEQPTITSLTARVSQPAKEDAVAGEPELIARPRRAVRLPTSTDEEEPG